VNVVGRDLEENWLLGPGPSYIPIAKNGLSSGRGLALRLLPVHLSLAFAEDRAFRHNGTSISLDGTSSDLAV